MPTINPARNTDPLLDVHSAAEYLGCSQRTIHRMVAHRELPVVRVAGRLRFRRSALEAIIAAGTTPAA